VIENLFWLSFFAMWWLLIFGVVEPRPGNLCNLVLFALCATLLAADRGVQRDKKEKGK